LDDAAFLADPESRVFQIRFTNEIFKTHE